MSKQRYYKGSCEHCAGHIEFPSEAIGTNADCPHCQKQTRLLVEHSRQLVRRILSLVLICLLFAIGAAAFGFITNKRQAEASAKSSASQQASMAAAKFPPPKILNDFRVSKLVLEKTDSSLMYAVGTVKNLAQRQRFGVKIELDLLDAKGDKSGTASDYIAVLESEGEWSFKALVTESSVESVSLNSINETP